MTYQSDLPALRQRAMELGVDLSTKRQTLAISARRSTARENTREAAIVQSGQKSRVFDALETAIVGIGNTLTLVLMLLLSNVALPVGVVGLGVVEMQRVGDGIALFDPAHAGLMALVAVSFYMVLLVIKAHLQINQTGTLDRHVWSFKLFARALAYRAGAGEGWQVQSTTPLQRLEATISAVGWVIIILGTLGSMKDKLGAVTGTWHEALIKIFTDSNLTDFLTYLGGFVFTAALLAATHWGVGYAYERYARLRPDVKADLDTTDAENEAEANYLRFVIAQLEEKQRPAAPAPASIPFGNTHPVSVVPVSMPIMPNGNGHTANGHHES